GWVASAGRASSDGPLRETLGLEEDSGGAGVWRSARRPVGQANGRSKIPNKSCHSLAMVALLLLPIGYVTLSRLLISSVYPNELMMSPVGVPVAGHWRQSKGTHLY